MFVWLLIAKRALQSPSYQGFQTAGGHDNTVSTLSNAEAGGKRRGMLPHYSPSSLAQWHDPVLVKSVEEALAYLRAKGADGKAVDVLELLGHTLVDVRRAGLIVSHES